MTSRTAPGAALMTVLDSVRSAMERRLPWYPAGGTQTYAGHQGSILLLARGIRPQRRDPRDQSSIAISHQCCDRGLSMSTSHVLASSSSHLPARIVRSQRTLHEEHDGSPTRDTTGRGQPLGPPRP